MLGQCANGGRKRSAIFRLERGHSPTCFHKPKYCTATLAPEHDLAKLYAIVEIAYFVCTWPSGDETIDLSRTRQGPCPAISRGSCHEHRRTLAHGSARRGGAQRPAAPGHRGRAGRQGG